MGEEREEEWKKYKTYFDTSPIPTWEEDLSEVFEYISTLPETAKENLAEYLQEHVGVVQKCTELVKLTDANQAMLNLFDATDMVSLQRAIPNMFTPSTIIKWTEALGEIYNGETTISDLIEFKQEDKSQFVKLVWINTTP